MKLQVINILIISALALTITSCGDKNNFDINNDENKFDTDMLSSENVSDLSQWEGEWDSFSEYCKEESLQPIWESVAGNFELNTEDFKEVFRRLCFVPDNVIRFDISGKTVKGYDTENNEVFSHDYEYAATFAQDSAGTVLKGDVSYVFKTSDENAGFYKYICLMPMCTMESSNGFMADHFHFSYGDSIERLINFSNVPTMLDSSITEEQKQQSVITFFSVSEQ